ncbi:MAG: CDP-6-deoxy-delta-3,4-glucoseen reductase [Chromatiales bacterium]|nr:CDP-6-deoxy-delta-3,4-glucoseen reductase [Chromatiales bacterium]
MSCKVHVDPSGHEFSVDTGESVLTAALRHGLIIPYGCRNGACGACKGNVLKGKVHYPSGKRSALSDEDEAAGLALFCQAEPLADLTIQVREIRTATEVETKRLPCRVVKMERLTHDVMRLYLKLPESERLQFLAGQYIEFLLKDGRRRAFSIANAPHDDDLIELHIRHVPGGSFTDHVFNELKEKSILRLEGPFGNFYLREDSDRPIVLMAGGTGFAPIKGIIEHAIALGLERPVDLYWGVRAKRDLYLGELAASWEQSLAHFRFIPVLSEPAREDDWTGRTGWVHDAVVADYPDLSGFDVYMGGPPPMVEAGKKTFVEAGLAEDHLYFDSFEFAADVPGTA